VVRRFALVDGSQPPHLRVDLEPGAGEPVLTGRVDGVRSATVEVRHYEPREIRPDDRKPLLQTVATSPRGEFAVGGLPPGRYRLIVRAEGMGTDARDVTVPAYDVVVDLQPAARLTVTGVDREGAPIADAWIHVEPAGSTEHAVTERRTGPDGRAVFEGLTPGRLLVCPARFGGFSAQRRGVPLDDVHVAPGASAELRVVIPQASPFALEVVDARERPLGGLEVAVRARRGFGQILQPGLRAGLSVTTDGSGVARVDLFPGSYDATIERDGAARTFPFQVGTAPGHRIVVEAAAAVLRGRVVDAKTGAPVKRIQVVWSRQRAPAITDDDGRFSLAVPDDDNLTLLVWPGRGPEGVTYPDSPYPSHARRKLKKATLPAGDLLIRLPCVRGAHVNEMPVALEVLVTDAETGAPLAGAAVYVAARREGFWYFVDAIHAGEGGRAVGHLIEADRYRLWVRGPDGASPRYEVAELERDGKTNEIRIGASLARGAK
jgi:hypothetical protein